MKNKSIIIAVYAACFLLICAVSLFGCGKKQPDETATESPSTSAITTTYTKPDMTTAEFVAVTTFAQTEAVTTATSVTTAAATTVVTTATPVTTTAATTVVTTATPVTTTVATTTRRIIFPVNPTPSVTTTAKPVVTVPVTTTTPVTTSAPSTTAPVTTASPSSPSAPSATLSYEEYLEMTEQEQREFMQSFLPNLDAYFEWYNTEKAKYDEKHSEEREEIGEGGSVDIGGGSQN